MGMINIMSTPIWLLHHGGRREMEAACPMIIRFNVKQKQLVEIVYPMDVHGRTKNALNHAHEVMRRNAIRLRTFRKIPKQKYVK